MNETSVTITAWARETFGEPKSIAAVAARAMQELAELVQKLCVDENHPGAREELADVRIVLAQVQVYLGIPGVFDHSVYDYKTSEHSTHAMEYLARAINGLIKNDNSVAIMWIEGTRRSLNSIERQLGGSWADVEAKMVINRARRWSTSGAGVGQHVDNPVVLVCRCGALMGKIRCPNCGRDAPPWTIPTEGY